jgi:hypothetical protein
MKLLTILALISVGAFFQCALDDAVRLQTSIDRQQAEMARMARVGR